MKEQMVLGRGESNEGLLRTLPGPYDLDEKMNLSGPRNLTASSDGVGPETPALQLHHLTNWGKSPPQKKYLNSL